MPPVLELEKVGDERVQMPANFSADTGEIIFFIFLF